MSDTTNDINTNHADTTAVVMSPTDMINEANTDFGRAFMEFDEGVGEGDYTKYFCFVEGYDRPYYHPRVSLILSENNQFIDCHCKRNVIKMHDRITSIAAYSQVKTLYFVDKDYDDNSGLGSDYFVTDYYSVENYYCSNSVLLNFLQNTCHLNIKQDSERLERVLKDFEEWKESFFNITKPFCAWYMTAHSRNIERHVIDYKEKFPTKYAVIDFRGVNKVQDYDLDDLNACYTPDPMVTRQEYDDNQRSITTMGDIRGKFVLQFMEAYVLHLDKSARKNGNLLVKPFSFPNNRPHIMSHLSGCAITTERLKSYILSRK